MAPSPSSPLYIFSLFIFSFSLFNPSITTTAHPNHNGFENPNLYRAYTALQAWKSAMLSDPTNFTGNWVGPDVCSYNGIFCAIPPGSNYSHDRDVASVDLNHADIAGSLPDQLGLLSHLAVFHINSNRFCGTVPKTFCSMKLLYELDLSNNRFGGKFPPVLLSLPSLKYLDIRFNEFEGAIPPAVFDKPLDALFLNNNRFKCGIPSDIGNSPVSVLVMANNDLDGCIPSSIGKMANTLNEIILSHDNLTGCLPCEIGLLNHVTVFDVGFNNLAGSLPASIGDMKSIEQLNVAHNRFTGEIPDSICMLPSLENFTYSNNFFSGERPACAALGGGAKVVVDGSENCIVGREAQRSIQICLSPIAHSVDCYSYGCVTKPINEYVHKRSYSPSGKTSNCFSPQPHDWGMASSKRLHSPPPPPSPSPEMVYDEAILPPVEGFSYGSPPPPPTIPY